MPASNEAEACMAERVDQILSPLDLVSFRSGFSVDRINQLARQAVTGSFPGAAPAMEMHIATHFRGGGGGVDDSSHRTPSDAGVNLAGLGLIAPAPATLHPRDRERVIIALMTATPHDPLFLAIHIYWGLMEGLSPEEIAWTQHLTSTYRGIDKFTIGIGVLSATLRAMRACLPKTDVDAVLAALALHITPLTRGALISL